MVVGDLSNILSSFHVYMLMYNYKFTPVEPIWSVIHQALMVVCDWELDEARKRDALDWARVHGEEPPHEVEERGLHAGI
jgi:hypothetical protein